MKVLTIGTFDLLHEGHMDLLKRCEELAGKYGGVVVVGVNTDRFVRTFKPAPIVPESSRLLALRGYAKQALLHDGNTPRFIESIKPDFIAIGSDWGRKNYLAQLGIDFDWLDARNISLAYLSRSNHGISSTELRKDVRSWRVVTPLD